MGDEDNSLTANNIRLLAKLAIFDALIRETPSSYAVNEHAQHALTDFCEEVYDAYRTLLTRLRLARQHCRV
jgi:hypothetical protein